jgi:hypothetical protein
MARWRPFHFRKRGKSKEYDALVEGVPPWLVPALIDWLSTFIRVSGLDFSELLRAMQVSLRIQVLDWRTGSNSAYESLLQQCAADPDLFLSVMDYVLMLRGSHPLSQQHVDTLEWHLETGGSAWMVAPDRGGLIERVQPEAVEAARQVIESGSRAGEYLAEAWRHTYGRNPHPGSGYREAVRAIEAAVCPVIEPKRQKPTLGTSIAALRSAPPGKFTTVFQDNAPGVNPLDVVLGLMGLLWTNQLDRHGAADDSVPLHVSPEQARAALHAAITLVQWFDRSVVRHTGS